MLKYIKNILSPGTVECLMVDCVMLGVSVVTVPMLFKQGDTLLGSIFALCTAVVLTSAIIGQRKLNAKTN